MEEMALKRWMGLFANLVENPDDPVLSRPVSAKEAIARGLALLPGYQQAVEGPGLDSDVALAHSLQLGALMLAALQTGAGVDTQDADKRVRFRGQLAEELVTRQPSPTYQVHNDWLQIQPQAGPLMALVTDLLRAKAIANRNADPMHMRPHLLVILEHALLWPYRVEVRKGTVADAAMPIAPIGAA